jgi:hypothetical protein
MYQDLWTRRDETVSSVRDLEGFDIEAVDGSIGKIDEATEEVSRSRVVVDTGPWIFGKKVCLPAGVIERIDLDDRRVFVGLSKDQIKDSPEYDPERDREDGDYFDRLGTYYGGVYSVR